MLVLRNGDVVELGPGRRGDFDFNGDAEQAHAALDLLRLLDAQHYFVFLGVVGVAQVKFRRACPVQPLAEELVDVGMRGLFDGLREIGGYNVFTAIHLEIVLDAAVKGVFAELVAQHIQHPAAFAVSVAVELAGIVEVVTHDRLVPQVVASEPFPRVVPAFVIGLILAKVHFGPYSFQKCGEPLVEPDVAPILAGDQVAEPLVAELVRD